MRKRQAAGGLIVLALIVTGCAGTGYGVSAGYDAGFTYNDVYPFGYYEPYGYYGGWGEDFFVGPPVRGGFWHRGPGGGRPHFDPGQAGHPMPSIPTAPRGGFQGGRGGRR